MPGAQGSTADDPLKPIIRTSAGAILPAGEVENLNSNYIILVLTGNLRKKITIGSFKRCPETKRGKTPQNIQSSGLVLTSQKKTKIQKKNKIKIRFGTYLMIIGPNTYFWINNQFPIYFYF